MRLINKDELIKYIETEGIYCDTEADKEATIKKINALFPTIDAVEVVKCKNCKFYETSTIWDKKQCTFWTSDPYEQAETEPNDYCSYGKRKE